MEKKPKNKMTKIKKNQKQTDDKENIHDFSKKSVSHGSEVQKDLHKKVFLEKS